METLRPTAPDFDAPKSGPLAFIQSLNTMNADELFSLDPEEIAPIQLAALKLRLEEFRPKIRLLDRLCEDTGVSSIQTAEDITPICFPHTLYKSYSVADIEKGRYDRLTRWLQTITAHDLSKVDLTGIDTLEGWISAVEAATPLRPLCSSGTTGKFSFFPATVQALRHRLNNYLTAHGRFRDELGSGLETGEVDFFTPWPVATGRHNLPRFFDTLRQNIYKDRPGQHVFTLGNGHWDLDMLWLSGRLRAAESKGETASLRLSPALEAVRQRIHQGQEDAKGGVDRFLDELIVKRRGERIFLFAPYGQMIAMVEEMQKRGLKAEWTPDTYILGGGRSGSKGVTYRDDWWEFLKEYIPYTYNETYGMTESTGAARRCSHGNFHIPHWVMTFLLDPDTSVPLERKGRQTGRLALFDLLAESYWGGAITGDRITIDFDGGCGCGRRGAFVDPDITRYSNLKDDDKITCSKSPGAYDEAVAVVLGEID